MKAPVGAALGVACQAACGLRNLSVPLLVTEKRLRALAIRTIALLGVALFACQTQSTGPANIGPVRGVTLAALPSNAAIIATGPRRDASGTFLNGCSLYALPRDGSTLTQITFDGEEHVCEFAAVSFDRRYIAQTRYPNASSSVPAQLWILDLTAKTEARLVPDFYAAGANGVIFGADGYVYFIGKAVLDTSSPLASVAGLNLYKVLPDGTRLHQLSTTADNEGIEDPGISPDGTLLIYLRFRLAASGGGVVGTSSQIWAMSSDGSNERLVYDAKWEQNDGLTGAHDPEVDNNQTQVVFSRTNTSTSACPGTGGHAHELWAVNMDGTGAHRLTSNTAGSFSITADWDLPGILYSYIAPSPSCLWSLRLIQGNGTGDTLLGPRPGQGVPSLYISQWIPNPP